MTFGAWFFIVWFVLLVTAVTFFVLRRRREAPTDDLIHGQPVIYATSAAGSSTHEDHKAADGAH